MRHPLRFIQSLSIVAAVCGLTACEIDLESGSYSGVATGTSRTQSGHSTSFSRNMTASISLAQDAGGVAPDLLMVTLCNDAIDAPTWTPCFEPIEVKVRQNHFGGEEWTWVDVMLKDSYGYEHYCYVEENVVISGDILSADSVDLLVTYYGNVDSYYDESCVELYTGVTAADFTASLSLNE